MMKSVFLLLAFLVVAAGAYRRHKRSSYTFAGMILAVTGIPPWEFNGHGNWCGYGGEDTPEDDLDKCCYEHDMCYNKVRSDCGWSRWYLYWYSYPWSYSGGQLSCGYGRGECRRELCICDKVAVECFNEHKDDLKGRKRDIFQRKTSFSQL